MGRILRCASAGNEAQNADCVVTLEPGENGIELTLNSLVENQYGDAIRSTVYEMLNAYGVTDCRLRITDRGAIDCVLRARLEAAIRRAQREEV